MLARIVPASDASPHWPRRSPVPRCCGRCRPRIVRKPGPRGDRCCDRDSPRPVRTFASCRTPGPTCSMSAPRLQARADGDRASGRRELGRVVLRPTRRRHCRNRLGRRKRGGSSPRGTARCSFCSPKEPTTTTSSRRCKTPTRGFNARSTTIANVAPLSAPARALPVRTAGKRGTACDSSRRKPVSRGTAASVRTCGNSPGNRHTRFGPSRRAHSCGNTRRRASTLV